MIWTDSLDIAIALDEAHPELDPTIVNFVETHFSPTWRFFKPSLSPARTRFKEIINWAKIGFF
jgi:hypothetical protein